MTTRLICAEAISLAYRHYEEDNQFQSAKPIGPQAPIPEGIHDMELSWDRKAAYMRIIIDKQTWHFKKLQGKVQITGTDRNKGRIEIHGMARIDGETLTLHRDPAATPHPMVEGTELKPTYNRLCYYRQMKVFRLRDERLPREHPEGLKLVIGYVGDWACSWPTEDIVAHVFHGPDGWAVIDEDGLAHLYDPDLIYT